MDEILALQAQLASAQDAKSSFRLNERNVIELVGKLKKLGYLDDTLMHTLDGKEFVTVEQLRKEIAEEVRASGGRVPVFDLQSALNIDVHHCEREAKFLAADATAGLSLVEGELMTPAYFDGVAAEVEEELRELGVVAVADLARAHGLSADLMSRALRERVGDGGIVSGRMEGGLLYTPQYVARLTAQLRGAMRAALTPTTRDALVTNALRGCDGDGDGGDGGGGGVGDGRGAGAELTGSIVGELGKNVDASGLDGVFQRGAWQPAAYSRAQTAAVGDLYATAGIVTIDQATRMGVERPREYFEALDPTATRLDASFVSASVVEQLDSAVCEALGNDGWCECDVFIPPDLPSGDAGALLAATATVKSGGGGGGGGGGGVSRVGDLGVATRAYLDKIGARARELGTEAGIAAAKRRQLEASVKGGGGETAENAGKRSKKKKGGGGGGGGGRRGADDDDDGDADAFAITADDLEDDDDDGGRKRGGKKGKGGKRGGNKGGGGGGAAAATAAATAATTAAAEDDDDDWNVDVLAAEVARLTPDASETFCLDVAKRAWPSATRARVDAMKAASVAGDDARRRARARAAAACDEMTARARMFTRGAELLPDDAASQRHCAKTHVVPLVDAFFRAHADADLDDAAAAAAAAATSTSTSTSTTFAELSPKQREMAANSMPKDARSLALTLATEATSCKSPGAMLRALDDLAEALRARLKPHDKKAERLLARAHKKTIEDSLATCVDPAAALLLAVPLAFSNAKNRAVAINGRGVAAAVRYLSEDARALSEDDASFLKTFHADVAASLAGPAGPAGAEVGTSTGARETEGGESLEERLPELRRIAMEAKKAKSGGGEEE